MAFNNFTIQWHLNTDLNLLILMIGNLSIETSQSFRDHQLDHHQEAEGVVSGVSLESEGSEEHQQQHKIKEW
jgi:hypothetical protein